MSTKVNLLPDVRQAKLRDKSRRRLAVSLMVGSIIVTAGLMIIGFLVIQGENLTINTLTSSIKDKKQQVASYPNVKPMLSLQARLSALPGLYGQRNYMTKLNSILSSIQPSDMALTSLTVTNGQLSIAANGKSYLTAARIAKALEQANVTVGSGASQSNQPYFTNVQLSAVTLASGQTSYSITANINPGATSGQ